MTTPSISKLRKIVISTAHVHGGPKIRFLRRFLDSWAQPATLRDAQHVGAACRALLSERGEISRARLAAEALEGYQKLDQAARNLFFDLLTSEFSANSDAIRRAADLYSVDPSHANLNALQVACESPRQELFRRFNVAPGGTQFMVEMRRQLLKQLGDHPEWAGVDADLAHLFRAWFNRGFLNLQQIDWRTSALVLERLIQHEAVHQIQGWHDLRRRLEGDRRCYAFFSPALPDEPLIFIEVALTREIPPTVQPLLDPEAPVIDAASASCAIFYSITSCQEGLRGISLGNFLTKQVIENLQIALPQIKTFASLSPIPGFVQWLKNSRFENGNPPSPELTKIIETLNCGSNIEVSQCVGLRSELSHLCFHYLVRAKRDKAPLDPVARFHLANGARLERLNWLGDTSAMGMQRSLGMTVNYVYRLKDVDRNHEAYASDYRIVTSPEFERKSKAKLGSLGG